MHFGLNPKFLNKVVNIREKISLLNLIEFGSFICFDEVKLSYIWGFKTIAEKCELLHQSIKNYQICFERCKQLNLSAGIDKNDQSEF